MSSATRFLHSAPESVRPADGTRRIVDQVERVFYNGYWIRTYPVPSDALRAKKDLIEGLTRRLFEHTEHGLNVPGARLKAARAAYDTESDPPVLVVAGGLLRWPLHQDGDGDARHRRDRGRHPREYRRHPRVRGSAQPRPRIRRGGAREKRDLSTAPEIFDVWAEFTTAGERLAGFAPVASTVDAERMPAARPHSVDDGLQLIRNGRALVFYIVRARTSMPKSTREFIERCEFYRENGRLPAMPVPLPG